MMKFKSKKKMFGLLLVAVLLMMQFIEINSNKKMFSVVESDQVVVTNVSNEAETEISSLGLFGATKSIGYYKKSGLNLIKNGWRKDYNLTFLKEGKKQVDVSIYTIDPKDVDLNNHPKNDRDLHYLNERYAVVEMKINYLVYKKILFANFSQEFFENIENLVYE